VLALHLDPAPRLDPDTPEPTPGPGEAVVALRLAGVCDTDLQLARGYLGFRGVPGHEFVGEVVACEDRAWVGRRVVGDINAGCGACADCLERDGHHCARRTVLGIVGRPGCLAERFALPAGQTVFEAVGCSKCAHTGFRGRIPIAEFKTVSPQMRTAIVQHPSIDALEQAAAHTDPEGLLTDGMRKVLAGLTTFDEVIRIAG